MYQKWLDRKRPSNENLNRLITKSISLRFEGKGKEPSYDTPNPTLATTCIHMPYFVLIIMTKIK